MNLEPCTDALLFAYGPAGTVMDQREEAMVAL